MILLCATCLLRLFSVWRTSFESSSPSLCIVVTPEGFVRIAHDAFSMDRRRPILVRTSPQESLCPQRFDFAHGCGHLIDWQSVVSGQGVSVRVDVGGSRIIKKKK